MIVAWTNADCAVFVSLHGPLAGSVAVIRYGVARPRAVSGFGGTTRVQFAFGSACVPPDGDGHAVGLALGSCDPVPPDVLALGAGESVPAGALALGMPAVSEGFAVGESAGGLLGAGSLGAG